ncbi:hypothetical protein ASF72_13555 [Arthrobacter sp. Leaf141]|uniref:hypothetical protein n=1 Tax=Arthrobacter sp. Leaf141 TaxID=1736273 RepID=UPI0006F60EAF|nr:hypothetical protein [Arthrobacter sp. Leaf141]KQR01238.1 hypothetical protein ASF72_13555 [Arthrobacter sp. Leaf141]
MVLNNPDIHDDVVDYRVYMTASHSAPQGKMPSALPVTVTTTPTRHRNEVAHPAYKANGDGVKLDTGAIQKAVEGRGPAFP